MNTEQFILTLEKIHNINMSLNEDGNSITSKAPKGWNDEEVIRQFKERRPQIIKHLKTESFVIRQEYGYAMLFEKMPADVSIGQILDADYAGLRDKPSQMFIQDDYFKYEEDGEFYYKDKLPDYDSTLNLYSDKFKKALDELGLEYEFAKPIYLFSREKNERFLYWIIVPKTISCFDKAKTIELRNTIDKQNLKPNDNIRVHHGRFVIDNSLKGDTKFFRLDEQKMFHLISHDIKEQLLKYDLVGVKFIATNRMTQFS